MLVCGQRGGMSLQILHDFASLVGFGWSRGFGRVRPVSGPLVVNCADIDLKIQMIVDMKGTCHAMHPVRLNMLGRMGGRSARRGARTMIIHPDIDRSMGWIGLEIRSN